MASLLAAEVEVVADADGARTEGIDQDALEELGRLEGGDREEGQDEDLLDASSA